MYKLKITLYKMGSDYTSTREIWCSSQKALKAAYKKEIDFYYGGNRLNMGKSILIQPYDKNGQPLELT